jgi:hypothetical protein
MYPRNGVPDGTLLVATQAEADTLFRLGLPEEQVLVLGGEGSGRDAEQGHQEGQAPEAEQAEEEVNSSL